MERGEGTFGAGDERKEYARGEAGENAKSENECRIYQRRNGARRIDEDFDVGE